MSRKRLSEGKEGEKAEEKQETYTTRSMEDNGFRLYNMIRHQGAYRFSNRCTRCGWLHQISLLVPFHTFPF